MAARRDGSGGGERRVTVPQLGAVLEELRPDREQRLLIDLINIYSPSFGEEEVQDFVSRYLTGHGVAIERQPVGEKGRYNVIATLGEGPVGLLLLGHIDTVLKWYQGDHRAKASGAVIHGLGAADMKSGCAAMIEAFIALSRQPHPEGIPAIALALVVGEEESGDGIEALIGRMKPELAVVGEPTGMRLCAAHYGYLEVLLTTHGRRAHSALPEIGHNAIDAMLRLIAGLTGSLAVPDEELPRPALVCNLREVRGGGNAFVVPEYCEAELDLHLPPAVKISKVKEEVRRRMRELAAREPNHVFDHQFKFGFDGYTLKEDEAGLAPLIEACEDVDLHPLRDAFRSHSDANCLRQHGTRPIVIGPGDLFTAHTVDERVRLEELHQATRLYAAMGARYRATGAGVET